MNEKIGRVTRDHGDIEFWVDRDRRDAHQVQRLLVAAGATHLGTQPPEEAAEYDWDGTWFSTAYFDARSDGTFTTAGRWDDWVFPVGSFPDEPVELESRPLLAMSVAGMLAMKEQFPHLRNGRPLRDKDIPDAPTPPIDARRTLTGVASVSCVRWTSRERAATLPACHPLHWRVRWPRPKTSRRACQATLLGRSPAVSAHLRPAVTATAARPRRDPARGPA